MNRMNKTMFAVLICTVTLFTLGMGTAAAATTVAVNPATVTSETCETVAIVINTDEAAGIGSVTMDLDYNPAIVTYNGKVADGDLGTVTVNQLDADTLRMVAATGDNPGPTGTVTIVELEFCPAGDPGECSDLALTVTEITDGNVAVIVPDSVANGQFCISGDGANTTVAVNPATVTSETCETVAIVINTDEAAGIGSVTMDLDYNPAIVTYNGKVADGDLGTVTVNQLDADTLRMVAATGDNPGPTGTVTIVELEFCPAGDPGECSDLALTVTEITDGNVAVIVPDSVANGQFCISGDGANTTVAVNPATVTSETCETVAIVINTDEAAGIGSVTMDLDYNPAIVTYNGKVADGDLGTVTVNQLDADTLRMVAATGDNPGPTGTVTIVELEFCPAGDPGECSDLALTVTEITDGNVAVIVPDSVANGQFCIGIPNIHPTVAVTYPTSGTVNGAIDVTADANDDLDPDGSVTQVAFYLMPAGTPIGTPDTNGADGWSVPLDTTTVTDGTGYQIKAVATDNEGATGENTGSAFAIDNSCPCDFCLDLDAGWNFVSVPNTLNGSDNNASTVFNLTLGETCLYYDYVDGWKSNGDIDVVPCQGYWVGKVASDQICLDFKTGPGDRPEQDLCKGWNMIGHIHTSTMPVDDGSAADFGSFTMLEGMFAQLWQWTQSSGWECYQLGDFTDMTPGQGYWILMTENATMYGTN